MTMKAWPMRGRLPSSTKKLEASKPNCAPMTAVVWRCAADRVIAALRGEDVPRETELEVALFVRGSTGPAPKTTPASRRPARRG
jgi:hypothetical protein